MNATNPMAIRPVEKTNPPTKLAKSNERLLGVTLCGVVRSGVWVDAGGAVVGVVGATVTFDGLVVVVGFAVGVVGVETANTLY